MSIPFPVWLYQPASAVAGCDDPLVQYEAALFAQYEQRLPRTGDGGRLVLQLCPACRHPWLQSGRHRFVPRLGLDEARQFAQRLCLRMGLARLPAAVCPWCQLRFLGGIVHAETLRAVPDSWCWWWSHLWSQSHAVCLLASVEEALLQDGAWLTQPEMVLPAQLVQMRAALDWVSKQYLPLEEPVPLSVQDRYRLQTLLPAASGMRWQGWQWRVQEGPQDQPCSVLLAWTGPFSSSLSPIELWHSWGALASCLDMVL